MEGKHWYCRCIGWGNRHKRIGYGLETDRKAGFYARLCTDIMKEPQARFIKLL